ncbi:MAG: hypothetical protein U0992_17845 [Planctomycetaceae bacterium]
MFERDVSEVCGCGVPCLVDYGDRLFVIEIEIVQPPHLRHFAGAYLDRRPDLPPDIYEAWPAE